MNDEIIIDLGSVCSVGSFSYQKRPGYHQSAWGVNGTMGEYALFVSTDGSEWTPAGTGSFTREEYGLHEVVLDEPQTSDGITHRPERPYIMSAILSMAILIRSMRHAM